jgi:outer membrane protein TolC
VREAKLLITKAFNKATLVQSFLWTAAGLVLLTGCTAAHYRRAADKEVYRIIQEAERNVFGHTNAFSIETRYSDLKPHEVLPLDIIEDRTRTNHRVVSLDEALDLAVLNSREYQAQREQLYLTALTLTGARYQFTPIFFADSTAQVSGTPDAAQIGSVRSRVGVSQFVRTGGRLSVALANDLLRYFTGAPPGNRDSAINVITVNLTQPLLRGFGRNDPAVENLTQAERNVIYAVRTFSQYQNQFGVNIVSDYFNLLGQKDVVRNNYTNYLRRVETTSYLEARAVDRVREADVEDARTAELSARIGYINSVAFYQNQLNTFKLRLGLPITDVLHLDDADLRELEQAGLIPVAMDPGAAFQIALDRHMDILNSIDRFEDSKRRIRLAADAFKPGLDFFANASLQSEPPDDYLNFDVNRVRYTAGVGLDLPIDRLRERNTYRTTLINFETQLRSLVATLDGYKDRIDRGFRTLEQQRQNFLNRQAALSVAMRRVDMNQTLLQAGRVQIRELREAQDALIAAQNQLTDSVVNYLVARMQLLLDIGVLAADTDRFWLRDPLAGELAGMQPRPAIGLPGEELVPPDQILEPLP